MNKTNEHDEKQQNVIVSYQVAFSFNKLQFSINFGGPFNILW